MKFDGNDGFPSPAGQKDLGLEGPQVRQPCPVPVVIQLAEDPVAEALVRVEAERR